MKGKGRVVSFSFCVGSFAFISVRNKGEEKVKKEKFGERKNKRKKEKFGERKKRRRGEKKMEKGFIEYLDLSYVKGSSHDKHKLDIYTPSLKGETNNDKEKPLVVFVHGGGWKRGDRRWQSQLGRKFVLGGILVIPLHTSSLFLFLFLY